MESNPLDVACPDCLRPAGRACYGTHIPHRARYTKAAERYSLGSVEWIIEAARVHGEDGDPEMEIGDLQDALRVAWEHLTPENRAKVLAALEIEEG